MKNHSLFILISCSFIWSPTLTADDFPHGFIARQIESAKNPIEVNIMSLRPGQIMAVEYVDMPVWIYRRTTKDIEYLQKKDFSSLADAGSKNLKSSIEAAYGSSSSYVWGRLLLVDQPEIEKTPYRSLKEEVIVVGGWSPHSGCVLTFQSPEKRDNKDSTFYDPCTGASFDVAGRVVKGKLAGNGGGKPASYNLYIPPHQFKNDTSLLIGLTETKNLPEIDVSKNRRYAGMQPTEKLITACRYNDLEIVKLALQEGADVNYYAFGKGSPIDAAIIGSSINIIELVIAEGAKPTQNSMNLAKFLERPEVVKLIEGVKK